MKSRNQIIIIISGLGIVLLLAIAAWYVFLAEAKKTIVIDRKEFPVLGIYISSHNGKIDFDKVLADSVSFIRSAGHTSELHSH